MFKGGAKRRVIQYSLPPVARVYVNPWKKVKGNWRAKLTAWLLSAVVVAWLGMMIYLPYFRINIVSFEGLKIIKQGGNKSTCLGQLFNRLQTDAGQ